MLVTHLEARTDIDYAYFQREFQIVYQPVFSLENQRIVGLESLLRWQQERMMLYPADFMQMLKSAGLSLAADCWVLREACHQMRHWQEQQLISEDALISVNISGEHLEHQQLINQVHTILQDANIPGKSLCLELSQSEIVGTNHTRLDTLKHIKVLDVKVCLDDFTPTIDSLEFLQNFSVDVIKVSNIGTDLSVTEGAFSLDRSTLKQIQNSGTQIVFKKIDNEPQIETLKTLGDHFCGQGFLFSQPLSQREATRLISQHVATINTKSHTLATYIDSMNKLSQNASRYLGATMVKRYWQTTRPASNWLASVEMEGQSDNLFTTKTNIPLKQEQQHLLQQWVALFIKQCSLIIRDFPILLMQADLSDEEIQLLKLSATEKALKETKRSLSQAA